MGMPLGMEETQEDSTLPKELQESQRNLEIRRNSLLQGSAHQLVIQYQMLSPKNMCTTNIVQTKQFIFRNIYANINTFMHAATVYEERGQEIWKRVKGVYERFWREKREEEMVYLLQNNKTKRNTFKIPPQKKKKKERFSFRFSTRHTIYFRLQVAKGYQISTQLNSHHMKSSMFNAGNHILKGRFTRH